MRAPSTSTYVGIFLVSAATLLLQVTLTRVFSVSIWYHFAFLVVSVALFGFGASGVALALVARGPRDLERTAWAPFAFGVTTLLAYVGSNAVPFSPFRIASDPTELLRFALVVVLLAVPFFFGGATVVLILRAFPARAGSLYAADLVGAAVGSLLLFVALPALGGPGSVALAAALAFASAVSLSSGIARARIASALALAASLPLLVRPGLLPDVRIDASKPLAVEVRERGGRIEYTGWNALSRIDVVRREGIDPMILIDSAAMTSIARPEDGTSPYIRNISTLAFRIIESPEAIIIGSGGGMDVQTALYLGARSIVCVEINPTIIELVTGRYRDHVGNVFEDPRVTIVRDEGRSFVDRYEGSADVIQLTLIDTWAAGASGAYSLTENYLYTTDAFRAYLEHLSPRGVLSVTRWYFEAPRVASLARAALETMGVADPGRHVLVVRRGISTTLLVKPTPFTPRETAGAHAFATEIDAGVVYDPVSPGRESFYDAFFSLEDPGPLLESQPLALHAVSDDNPFFFQMGRWKDLSLTRLREVSGENFLEPLALPVGQIALLAALVVGLCLSVLLLLVPLLTRRAPRKDRYGALGYFLGLGLAFIVVEVVLMQRFALFLGHPTYAVTVVLFAILLFSGLGSAASERWGGTPAALAGRLAVLLPLAILLLAFAVPPLTRALIGLPHAARLAIAAGCIAPVAFLMGMPFPTGLRVAAASSPSHVAWAWAANGCASVVGSVLAVLGAMTGGFSIVLVGAGLVYATVLTGFSRSRLAAGG